MFDKFRLWPRFLVLLGLSFLVFWPGIDNGFISDDYVFLERVDVLVNDPLYLFSIPPEFSRTTTYLVFLLLKTVFGPRAWVFYVFTIALHAVCGFLLGRLVSVVSGNKDLGFLAAILFVSMQQPQEAFLWLGGMHETLLGLFVMAALICWVRRRLWWSLLFYSLALFSKESALVFPLLIVIVELWGRSSSSGMTAKDGRSTLRDFGWVFAATLGYCLLLLLSFSSNSLVEGGFYALSPSALFVWLNSLHRLAFPWLYLFGLLAWLDRDRKREMQFGWPLAWMAAALLPYIFLTYQNHVPSRHEHLSAMGTAAALAALMAGLSRPRLQVALLACFIVVNAGYVLQVKDRQFEERAAPTEQLLLYLRKNPPRQIRLVAYPFNIWTAKLTTRLAPGWTPDLVAEISEVETCADCQTLRWDAANLRYVVE